MTEKAGGECALKKFALDSCLNSSKGNEIKYKSNMNLARETLS
jgi:hypothetical protein